VGCLGKVGPLLDEATALRIPVSEYKIRNLYNVGSLRARLNLRRYLNENSIHVVHTYGFYSNLFAIPAARLAGVPVVIASIRDCGESLTPAQKQTQKMCCMLADCILVNADAVRQWLLSCGYPDSRIRVVRNGIDSEFRRPATSLRRELGLSGDTPLVAVLARLNPLKGLEYFLEAAAVVSSRFPRARFLIIGGPDQKNDVKYREQLEALAANLGLSRRAIFMG